MKTYIVHYAPSGESGERTYLGIWYAMTEQEAIEKCALYYTYPPEDITAKPLFQYNEQSETKGN